MVSWFLPAGSASEERGLPTRGQPSPRSSRGVALNPAANEIIVADMRLNAVLTYYFPEIF